LNTTPLKEDKLNTNKSKEPSKNKFPDKLSNTKPLKKKSLNKFPEKKFGPTTKLLNIKKNIFPEPFTIPFKNKSPSPELNTSPFKELNTFPKKKLNISLNPDKLKELNTTKLNTKFKDLNIKDLKFKDLKFILHNNLNNNNNKTFKLLNNFKDLKLFNNNNLFTLLN